MADPVPTMRQSRVLVTGGAGFLGSHLCRQLLAEGHEVICVDNFFTGQKRNVRDLLENPDFEIIRHDIVNPIFLEVDQIYNLACPASPVHYQYNPVKTIKTSVLGTANMLGLAKRLQARFLQASTSEVYGDPEEPPKMKTIGATLIQWGLVHAMMKVSAAPRHSALIITARMVSTSGLRGSSIPTAQRWIQWMAEWSATLLCRP